MFTKQMPMLQGLTEYFPDAAVAMLTGVLGQCNAELEHRGPITIDWSPPPEATQAALTLNNYQQDESGNETGRALSVPHGSIAVGDSGITDQDGNDLLSGRWVEGTLGSGILSSAATATLTVTRYWGYRSPGTSVTVNNPPSGIYGGGNYVFHAPSSAWCRAQWDSRAGHWRISYVECGEPE